MPKMVKPFRLEAGGVYVGIDPGKSGGIAAILSDGRGVDTVKVIPIPTTERDLWNTIHEFRSVSSYGVIEHVTPMPSTAGGADRRSMPAMSAFTFGAGYGGLRMALTAAGIKYEPILPRTWQKALGITPRKKTESKSQFKERLRAKAQQLFPALGLWDEPKSRGRQLSVCDALLLAEFCRRRFTGIGGSNDQ